ncbi:MAG: DUF3786 domain-containing protein [Deltaproteobacteria bacterium]|jgi:hypothetical protein|nr:DUF3786 domain-containing protein [Deltaproteobacteria bacterium]
MSKAKTIQSRVNYSKTQLAALKETNLAVQAKELGLSVNDKGQVPLSFLGQAMVVSLEGIESVSGGQVSVDAQSVVAHYLISRGRGPLKGEYVPINRLTGISVSPSSPSANLAKPLEMIDGDYERFQEAARKIGGRYEGLSQAGGQAWLFGDLPLLPVRIEFFEKDDEFPFEIKILFDATANIIASYEGLELYIMCLTVGLLMAGGWITDPDDCERSFL